MIGFSARWLLAAGLCATAAVGVVGQDKKGKADLVVADVAVDGDDLVLVVQNQGPGTAKKGTFVSADISIRDFAANREGKAAVKAAVPPGPFDLIDVKVPLKTFGLAPDALGRIPDVMVSVVLDRDNKLAEEREKNNDFYRQVDRSVPHPRGDFRGAPGLPDLVVTDINVTKYYVYTTYKNQGEGVTGADFLVATKYGKQSYPGNRFYRFRVPAVGVETKTGGLTHNLPPGTAIEFEVVIDHDDRVLESNEKNNSFKKKLVIPAE